MSVALDPPCGAPSERAAALMPVPIPYPLTSEHTDGLRALMDDAHG